MATRVNVDGVLGTAEDRLLSPLDLGFVFGASVYETLRTYGGRAFLLARHLQRLRESAASLKISVEPTDDAIAARVQETMAAAANAESLVRIIASAGVGDLDYRIGSTRRSTLVILVKPLPPESGKPGGEGIRAALVDVVRNHPKSVNPRIKSSNLLNNLLAMREAQARGAEEAILLNYRGEVAEGSLTNVFVVSRRAVKTPSLDSGILAGITRELALEIAGEQGFETEETTLLPGELLGADEVFLTGTTKEVLPVVFVNETPIGDGKPGPVTLVLRQAYRRKVRELAGLQ